MYDEGFHKRSSPTGLHRRLLLAKVRKVLLERVNARGGPTVEIQNVNDLSRISNRSNMSNASNSSSNSINSTGSGGKRNRRKKKVSCPTWLNAVNCRRRQRPPSLRRLVELGEWDMAKERLCTPSGKKEAKVANEFGRLALHIACLRGAPPNLVSALLEAHPEAASTMDKLGKLPIHCACVMMGGSLNGTGGTGVGVAVGGGWMHGADCGGEVMNVLLKADPSSARRRDRRKDLPLHILASSCGIISDGGCGRSLFKATEAVLKSYPEAAKKRDRNGNLPLHLACRQDDNVDDDNFGPFHRGIRRQRFRGNNHLIEEFPSFSRSESSRNVSVKIVKLILEANPAAARMKGRAGLLPIHFAFSNSSSEEENADAGREAVASPVGGGPTSFGGDNLRLGWAPQRLQETGRTQNIQSSETVTLPPVVEIVRALLDVYPEGAVTPDPRNGRTWSRKFLPSRTVARQ